ncbi:MAG TPA: hypothetical protein VGM10_09110 [Actinocrinis sp.]
MAGPKQQPPLEDAADPEAAHASGHEHRGEWERAVHDEAHRDPVHESLQKAHETVHGERSDSDDGAAGPAGDSQDADEVTRGLRTGTGERPGEAECSQFAPPKDEGE